MAVMYRTHRPQKFDDLIGQDHIRLVLENALKNSQVGHAYLFSGPRGTGKTTTARLLAKALSCKERKDYNPCNKCDICLEIEGGGFVDIIEIDAASNRGVDDVRQLRDAIATGPTRGGFKVYIIDEVHMLTKEAFNALLKTLEEPPSHVVFILATTELHKVPDTIISRCQRLFFNRADSNSLVKLLKDVVKKEKLKADEGALELVAQRSEGSYRDALSLLNSLSNTGIDLTEESVRSTLQLPSSVLVSEIIELIKKGDRKELARNLKGFLEDGGDIVVIVKEISRFAKIEMFKEKSDYPEEFLLPLLEATLAIQGLVRNAVDPETLALAKLLSICKPSGKAEVAKPIEIKEVKEEKEVKEIKETVKQDIVQEIPSKIETSVDTITSPSESVEEKEFWPLFTAKVYEKNHALYAVIRSAQMKEFSPQKLIIAVKFKFYAERLFEPINRKQIEACISEITGVKTVFECIVEPEMELVRVIPKDDNTLDAVVDVFEIEES